MASQPDPVPSPATPRAQATTVANVTCLACGCLCDDLTLQVIGDQFVEIQAACELGLTWFQQERPRGTPARIGPTEASLDQALEHASNLIAQSHAPVVFGLTRTTTETVRASIALAEILGARLVLDRGPHDLRRVAAFQNRGKVSATLGEVRNRADVVVFWRVDPVTTHPRHAERYSVEPAGRFLPGGRADRTVIVVDDRPTATTALADLVLLYPGNDDYRLISLLRQLVRQPNSRENVAADAERSPDLASLIDLASRLKQARYAAIFHGESSDDPGRSGPIREAMTNLVRDVNAVTRCVELSLGAPGNLAGAEAAMTWQGGFLQGLDYGQGLPSPLDEHALIQEILEAGEADLLISVANPIPDGLSPSAQAHLASIARIHVGGRSIVGSEGPASVCITTAEPGLETGGSVTRCDGVSLPLRPVRRSPFPTDLDVIQALIERVTSRGKATS